MKTPSPHPSLRRCSSAVFALFLGFASCASAAELKIGIIDLSKVFKSYYKTKLADASIQDEVSGLDKELKAFSEEHDKAVSDYKKALEEANNQAVSQDEREKRKKEAEGKLIKVNDLRQTIEQFKASADTNIKEKLRRSRDSIVGQISGVVSNMSKTLGYSLVLDVSPPDPGARPSVVIYSNGENDLTAAVITHLNADAPPNLPLDDKKDKTEKDKGDEKKKNDTNKKLK